MSWLGCLRGGLRLEVETVEGSTGVRLGLLEVARRLQRRCCGAVVVVVVNKT